MTSVELWLAAALLVPVGGAPGPAEDTFLATLRPGRTALIKARQDEQVAEVPRRAGARVQTGALLVRFVDDEERIRVERADALLDQARAELARAERLHAEGQVADELLDEARTKVRVAEADLALARVRLEELSVLAPFDGVLIERFVDAGTSVEVGDPLVRVVSIDRLRLEALVPQEQLPRLRGVERLRVTVAATGESFTVPFELGPVAVDPASGQFTLRVEVDNTGERVLAGGRCTVSFDTPTGTSGER